MCNLFQKFECSLEECKYSFEKAVLGTTAPDFWSICFVFLIISSQWCQSWRWTLEEDSFAPQPCPGAQPHPASPRQRPSSSRTSTPPPKWVPLLNSEKVNPAIGNEGSDYFLSFNSLIDSTQVKIIVFCGKLVLFILLWISNKAGIKI